MLLTDVEAAQEVSETLHMDMKHVRFIALVIRNEFSAVYGLGL
jgi:hypothetical protein